MELARHRFGDGPRTVGIVHGISSSGALWRGFAERLAERHGFRTIAVDLRGHGDSPHADRYRVADFADDLVDTLPTGLDLVIGHSLGGRALAEAAARLRPRRAVYLDPAFALDLTPAGAWLVGHAPGVGPLLAAMLTTPHPRITPGTRAEMRRIARSWDRRMARAVVGELAATPLPDGLPPVPSTVVRASGSGLLRESTAARLDALGWDVRRTRGGHDLHLLDPDGVLRLLDDVLSAGPETGPRAASAVSGPSHPHS